MRLQSLKKRLRSRSRNCRADAKAKADPLHLVCLRDRIRSPKEMTRKDVTSEWQTLCARRSIPTPEKGVVPILNESDPTVRDAGIRWYTGSFPGEPDIITTVIGDESYQQHKSRVDYGMRMDTWNGSTRKRTTSSIKVLVDAIDKYWIMGMKKRKRDRLDEGDEEWHPRRRKR